MSRLLVRQVGVNKRAVQPYIPSVLHDIPLYGAVQYVVGETEEIPFGFVYIPATDSQVQVDDRVRSGHVNGHASAAADPDAVLWMQNIHPSVAVVSTNQGISTATQWVRAPLLVRYKVYERTDNAPVRVSGSGTAPLFTSPLYAVLETTDLTELPLGTAVLMTTTPSLSPLDGERWVDLTDQLQILTNFVPQSAIKPIAYRNVANRLDTVMTVSYPNGNISATTNELGVNASTVPKTVAGLFFRVKRALNITPTIAPEQSGNPSLMSVVPGMRVSATDYSALTFQGLLRIWNVFDYQTPPAGWVADPPTPLASFIEDYPRLQWSPLSS